MMLNNRIFETKPDHAHKITAGEAELRRELKAKAKEPLDDGTNPVFAGLLVAVVLVATAIVFLVGLGTVCYWAYVALKAVLP